MAANDFAIRSQIGICENSTEPLSESLLFLTPTNSGCRRSCSAHANTIPIERTPPICETESPATGRYSVQKRFVS